MRTALLIAGMHRSGTSATAGALHISGVALGGKLLPATPENARGYWENVEILRIHEALLDALDLAWDDVRPLPAGWEVSTAANEARRSLREWIAREFANTALWGAKDPRLCRLLPIWLDVLRQLAIEPVVLLVVRNPAEVADSIKARDGYLEGVGELLWLRHVCEAEASSRHVRRCAVTYEQLIADPVQTLSTIASRLHLSLPRAPRDVAPELQAFVDEAERHQYAAAGNRQREPSRVAMLIRSLYQAMARVAGTGEGWERVQRLAGGACELIDREGRYLHALAHGLPRLRRSDARARDQLLQEATARERRLSSEVESVVAERDAIRMRLASVEHELDATREHLLRELQAHIGLAERLRAELESIRRSRSWRLTAPLRWANQAAGAAIGRRTTFSAQPSSTAGRPATVRADSA